MAITTCSGRQNLNTVEKEALFQILLDLWYLVKMKKKKKANKQTKQFGHPAIVFTSFKLFLKLNDSSFPSFCIIFLFK